MTVLDTRFTELLGLDVGLVQAPIGSASCPALAAAVADAGALGTLAVTWRDPAATRTVLEDARSRTDGVVGANVVVDPDAKSVPTATHVDACLAAGVEVFSFSFGLPPESVIERVHDHGGVVLQSVGSADAAVDAVEAGADVVVAQGWEAGGHVEDEVASLPLVPRVVDAVPDVPVVAAGGIADGRGVAAVRALGADGAWLGTRFLATEEANVHRLYRDRVVDAAETDTEYGTPFDDGWPDAPHRVLGNETTDAWVAAGRPRTNKPGADDVVATRDGTPIRRYDDDLATPDVEGDVESLPLYAGQSAGLTDAVRSADEVVASLVAETEDAVEALD